MAKRKIGFYYLFLKLNDLELSVEDNLNLLLDYLQNKSLVKRKQDMTNDKFAFIDRYELNTEEPNHLLKILFKSAKHSYRAPLLDKNTMQVRDNPKTMSEGEQMKTHVLIKYKDGDAILFLETGNNMLTCANIVEYLNKMLSFYNAQFNQEEEKIQGGFCFDMIPRDDFREVLANMDRVVCAEVYVDKQILGSDMLNFSNPSDSLKEEIILNLKANRKMDIKQHVYDFVDKLNGTESNIRRIRVKGKLGTNNESIIDTGFIIKKEYIEVQQDEDTGEYNTLNMFSQLTDLSHDY